MCFNVNNDNHSHLVTNEKLISATLVESVLSRQPYDPGPTLARHGYWLKDIVEQFDVKQLKSGHYLSTSYTRHAQLNYATECWR